jgi:hypothetical protein
MVVIEKRIPYRYGGEPVRMRISSDLHLGHVLSKPKLIKKFLEEDQEAFHLFNGDLHDAVVTADTRRYRKAMDATHGQDIIDEQLDEATKIFEDVAKRGKIIGIGTGNHEQVISRKCNTNLTRRLCRRLEVPFLGYTSIIILRLHENGARIRTVRIRMHHGYGGSCRTPGGEFTKYAKSLTSWDVHAVLYGHGHQLGCRALSWTTISGKRLIRGLRWVGLTGTFMDSVAQGHQPSYAEEKDYPPAVIGGLIMEIKPTERFFELSLRTREYII